MLELPIPHCPDKNMKTKQVWYATVVTHEAHATKSRSMPSTRAISSPLVPWFSKTDSTGSTNDNSESTKSSTAFMERLSPHGRKCLA
jgi:hypothetical protein